MISAESRSALLAEGNPFAVMTIELRPKHSLTQEQFAVKVGVTWSTVNRWENGRVRPSPLAMRQINDLSNRQDGDRNTQAGKDIP